MSLCGCLTRPCAESDGSGPRCSLQRRTCLPTIDEQRTNRIAVELVYLQGEQYRFDACKASWPSSTPFRVFVAEQLVGYSVPAARSMLANGLETPASFGGPNKNKKKDQSRGVFADKQLLSFALELQRMACFWLRRSVTAKPHHRQSVEKLREGHHEGHFREDCTALEEIRSYWAALETIDVRKTSGEGRCRRMGRVIHSCMNHGVLRSLRIASHLSAGECLEARVMGAHGLISHCFKLFELVMYLTLSPAQPSPTGSRLALEADARGL